MRSLPKLTEHGNNTNRKVVAPARELFCFVWAIGRQPKLVASWGRARTARAAGDLARQQGTLDLH